MAASKASLFKSAPAANRVTKADQITETVRGIIEAETRARNAKTEKLRALRLEKEAAEAAEAEANPAPKKKVAKKKAAVVETVAEEVAEDETA